MTFEEYLDSVRSKLNLFERASAGFSSLDERIDMTNKILINISGQLLVLLERMNTFMNTTLVRTNPLKPISRQKLVPTAGTAVQLPNLTVPYDMEVVILALTTNTDTVYVASSKLEAEDSTMRFPLQPGEAVSYQIENLNELWIDADVADEGVVWTVEQEKTKEGSNG